MRKICPVRGHTANGSIVYFTVRDYFGIDMDGLIGIPLDEIVNEIAEELCGYVKRKNPFEVISDLPLV